MENVPLFDVSSEDDLLIPASSQEVGNMEAASKKVEQLQLSESPEQNLKRSDRYNLRKSLAWDSAFFASEGILNPEELEIMNSAYNKAMGTVEELRKSSESTSTLDSESLALEQPELNLFENVRDSIQKSLGSYNHTTKMIQTKEPKKADAPRVRTLKKVDISSQKLKSPSVSRRHNDTQLQEHTSKDGLVCLKVSSHGKRVSKSSLRPPKVSSKTILPTVMPGQKSSFAITQIKGNTGKALPGATAKQQPTVAFSNANEVQNIAHRPTSSTRYIAGSSQTDLVLAAALGTPSTCSNTSSSDSNCVSSQAIVKERSADKYTAHFSFRASKTPLKSSRKGAARSHHPYLPKSSLVLSKVSPTSSINSVASESSSTSTSMMLVSLEGYDASSQNSDSLSQTFTEDPTKSCVNHDISAKPAKPSALRVPRPTVGYFDKEKTVVHRTNKVIKSGLQDDLNAGVHAIATANKMKPCNIPTLRNGALPSALSKQGTNPAEVQVVHMKIENHHVLSPKVNRFSSEIAEENHRINLKAGRVHDDRAEKVQTCNTSKKEIPNPFQPSPFAPANEIHATGKQRTPDQSSYTMQVQLENVNNDLSALDSKIEKENLSPALKIEGSCKVLHTEDQYASATEKLAEMISSLSLSAA